MTETGKRGWWGRLPPSLRRRAVQGKREVERRVPPAWRVPAGVALIAGGTVGFLPVVGFWMIPLGVMVIAAERRARRRKEARLAASAPKGAPPT